MPGKTVWNMEELTTFRIQTRWSLPWLRQNGGPNPPTIRGSHPKLWSDSGKHGKNQESLSLRQNWSIHRSSVNGFTESPIPWPTRTTKTLTSQRLSKLSQASMKTRKWVGQDISVVNPMSLHFKESCLNKDRERPSWKEELKIWDSPSQRNWGNQSKSSNKRLNIQPFGDLHLKWL